MNFEIYKQMVAELPIGKRLPDAVYLHESCLPELPPTISKFIQALANEYGHDFSWNVAKLFRKDFKISLLSYPEFFENSYPELSASLTIDLVRGQARKSSYQESNNPPILHRKETLIPPHHEAYRQFAEITIEGEKAGLYENPKVIGFKGSWERVISSKGYKLVDGHLLPKCQSPAVQIKSSKDFAIQRHLTAVDRDKLSVPMQSLAKHGYLDGDHTVFDYGCGKGHDLLELEAHGIDATGWDPAYRPETEKRPSDIVNLGFVINVIENYDERAATLKQSYALANRILVVSAMLGGEATTGKFTPYKDGVVTSRGTFQKYYTQSELRDFIERSLGTKPTAIGPGLFYVFKDELEEQLFLSERQRVRREWNHLHVREKSSPKADYQELIERHVELFKEFWQVCIDFGRSPANDEFERSEEIRSAIGSHRKALHACVNYFGSEIYKEAQIGRKKDLTVFLALSFFDRRRAHSRMPRSLQRDIRAFFEKPSFAYSFAKQALFAIADQTLIADACRNAHRKLGCGRLEETGALIIQAQYLSELPPLLRIYVGSALQLYGDIDEFDLVKIHVTSSKVSLLKYNDFSGPLPKLTRRIKISMRDQHIDYFDYGSHYEEQVLYQKSQFLKVDDPDYEKQQHIDKIQRKTGLSFEEHGPSFTEFRQRLERLGLEIPGASDPATA